MMTSFIRRKQQKTPDFNRGMNAPVATLGEGAAMP